VLSKGSEPYLDQLFRDGRWCEYTRLSDDTRDQVGRLGAVRVRALQVNVDQTYGEVYSIMRL